MENNKSLKMTQRFMNEVDEMIFNIDNKRSYRSCNDVEELFNAMLRQSVNMTKEFALRKQYLKNNNVDVNEIIVNQFVRKRK